MIGTITNVSENEQGTLSFKERLTEALKEHFDSEDLTVGGIPELFTGSPYDDVPVTLIAHITQLE